MASSAPLVLSALFSLLLASNTILPGPTVVHALPTTVVRQVAGGRAGDLAVLSEAEVATFRPFTQYASAAYCKPKEITSWGCGIPCRANPKFKPIAAGGDGNHVQYWFVGIDPVLNTIIVAHQGTDPTKLMPVLTDLDARQINLDSNLFPGLPKDIKVHSGFANSQAETSAEVLTAVKKSISESGIKQITVVGHSLGGAIALLTGIYLPLAIPDATVRTITYGQPRVGNEAFVQYVDAKSDITRINNQDDMVPIVPGRRLGYRHSKGEKHIQDNGEWLVCPGGDNTDARCSVGDVTSILKGSVLEHIGPYDGVWIRC